MVSTTVGVLIEDADPLSLVSAKLLEPRSNPRPKKYRTVYGVTSLTLRPFAYQVLLNLRAGDPAWSEAVRSHYLAAPSDPRSPPTRLDLDHDLGDTDACARDPA